MKSIKDFFKKSKESVKEEDIKVLIEISNNQYKEVSYSIFTERKNLSISQIEILEKRRDSIFLKVKLLFTFYCFLLFR